MIATVAVAVSLHFFDTYVGGAVKSAKKALGAGLPGPAGVHHGGCRCG